MAWSISANLAGVAGGGDFVPLPVGVYKAQIVSTEEYTKQDTGSTTIKFQLRVTEGPHKGGEARVFIGMDLSKQGNMISLKNALLSIGTKPEVLEQGQVKITDKTFEGKACYIRISENEKPSDPKYKFDVRFITAARFESENGRGATGNGAAVPQPNGANLDALMGGVSL